MVGLYFNPIFIETEPVAFITRAFDANDTFRITLIQMKFIYYCAFNL